MQNLQYPTLHRSHLRPRCSLSGRRRWWPHAGGRWTLVNDTLAALARQCGSDDEIWNTSVPTTDRDRFAWPHGRSHLFGQMRRYMDFNSVGQDDAFDVPDTRQRECLDCTGDVHLLPPRQRMPVEVAEMSEMLQVPARAQALQGTLCRRRR